MAFPTASSLPYFVAIERGFFKEQNIEPETIRLIGGPPNIAAMISNQIEAAVVLVTIEAMNANLKKPGVAMYIGVHSQSKIYQMEQFVARTGYAAATLKDLKGARIMSAPGPANLVAAKAVLAKVGLNDGDYTIDQLDMSQHVNVMTSGTFDAGYTLEPQASTMRKLGVARMTAREIEAARRAMARYVKRGGQIWVRVFPDVPITKKPLEVRMGSGKGNVEYYVARVQPGKVLFEMEGVDEVTAREAFRLAGSKLSVSTSFVKRQVR